MNATTKRVLTYAILPGFIPRFQDLFVRGFSNIAFFMAVALRTANLLPSNHPYLWASNFGRFGIRHVLAESYRNLEFRRDNLDRIIIYFIFLSGFLLVLLQMFLFIMALITPYANAGIGAEFFEHFGQVNDPTYDLAFIFLERVFGYDSLVNGAPLYNSCVAQGISCRLMENGATLTPYASAYVDNIPNSLHNGLHNLIYFYNLGILAIGLIIFLYLVATVVGETAVTGTPFGRRFNRFWAPVRMIIALALLFPYTGLSGINAAQLITLYTAKWGSNLATNTWGVFLDSLAGDTPLGDINEMVVAPTMPTLASFNEFMFVAKACTHAEELMNGRTTAIYVVRQDTNMASSRLLFDVDTGGTYFNDDPSGDYEVMRDFALATGGSSINFVIGELNEDEYTQFAGGVKPICGTFSLPIHDVHTQGSIALQKSYVAWIDILWESAGFNDRARNLVLRTIPTADKDPGATPMMNADTVIGLNDVGADYLESIAVIASNIQALEVGWQTNYLQYGWGGAAIWYNKIAEFNGSLISSANSPPTVGLYPSVMEYVVGERKSNDNAFDLRTRYNPVLSDGQMVNFERDQDAYIANTLFYGQSFYKNTYESSTGSSFTDAIKQLFGLGGLFDMVQNYDSNPLAQLVGIGRSLIESTVANFGVAAGSGVFGVIASAANGSHVGSLAFTVSKFSMMVGLTGLSIGFILFYIVPFMPFIYFFFALGGWVRGIFEAMVGLPLWGLAHIRIDGEGLPGPVGMNGYYLIFEIFIRPVLIVFGLIGGLVIFTAQVSILHEIWSIVVTNVAGAPAKAEELAVGFDLGVGDLTGAISYVRSGVDQLFYTIMYAIIVYLMAVSSFKMVDQVPNNILRWLGTSVSTFGENNKDPAANIMQYSFVGSNRIIGQFGSMFGGKGNFLSNLFGG